MDVVLKGLPGLLSRGLQKLNGFNPKPLNFSIDLTAIALLILPLTLARAIVLALGTLLNYFNLPELASYTQHISNSLIGLYPLALCICTAYYFSHKTSLASGQFIFYTISLYFLFSVETGKISPDLPLPNSSFFAIISSLVTYRFCKAFPLDYLTLGDNTIATKTLRHAIHYLAFVVLSLLLSLLSPPIVNALSAAVRLTGFDPMTLQGALAYQLINSLLWCMGIHGTNILLETKTTIEQISLANIEAWQAGIEPLQILTDGFNTAYLNMGGIGSTFSLVLCILLFTRNRTHRQLALAALPFALFNINEVILFGLPVLFNPLLIIPFILVPLVNILIAYSVTLSGLIPPVETTLNWLTPPLMSGYIATGFSFSGVMLQLVLISIGILIYRPFYLAFAGSHNDFLSDSLHSEDMDRSLFLGTLDRLRGQTYESRAYSQAQQRLKSTFKNGVLVMHYQEIRPFAAGYPPTFEALIRLKDAQGQLHPPRFIADFQSLKLMPMLDRMVIDSVLKDLQPIPRDKAVRIAINISVASILQEDFADRLLERLDHYEIPRHWLEIEITEEAILNEEASLKTTMTRLQACGINFSIDDFGSGYASFPHIMKYHFNKIKLDRSLLLDAVSDQGKDLYQLIAGIGKIANCSTVAEGVETEEECAFVKDCGIDLVQGFLFARPAPIENVLKALDIPHNPEQQTVT
ncbi:EAL domain-containing protein [Parendozoicomonas haliclonae]|uniref:Lichenan permease IIC component n=1 Tax=Parendozoicomonas haliclonae TaxID=1960125 RepID=A0A1X7ARK2_9GAMM|nr:EAL domain-containing protein [Parendozoicomonas haliclonae]SMA50936.1 Lichenan permease IIC component [Parendozoicomonas haliclonae]